MAKITGMERDIERYRNSDPVAVCSGSHAQTLCAVRDARNDILVLWDALEAANEKIRKLEQA